MAEPTNESSKNPSFVYDYLACKLGNLEDFPDIVANPYLCWVEIKTGGSYLSDSQDLMLNVIKLPLAIFYIEDVVVHPKQIDIEYDIKTGKEWDSFLNGYDPKR